MQRGVAKHLRTGSNHENGIVAILDALGAGSYQPTEIERFLESRQLVLQLFDQKAEDIFGEIRKENIATFTFNDTILFILRTGPNVPGLQQISDFFRIIRKFLVDSLANRILLRGSIAIGKFYVDNDTNTVMGEAVTDAAGWYDKADWIGVHATPRTTLIMQRKLEHDNKTKENVQLDYDVPLKRGLTVRAKAVNWPKVFFVDSITPCTDGTKPREKLIEFLTRHQVPRGTEGKFFNTINFFDYVVKKQKLLGKSATANQSGTRKVR
jgi:hypothetical protein